MRHRVLRRYLPENNQSQEVLTDNMSVVERSVTVGAGAAQAPRLCYSWESQSLGGLTLHGINILLFPGRLMKSDEFFESYFLPSFYVFLEVSRYFR